MTVTVPVIATTVAGLARAVAWVLRRVKSCVRRVTSKGNSKRPPRNTSTTSRRTAEQQCVNGTIEQATAPENGSTVLESDGNGTANQTTETETMSIKEADDTERLDRTDVDAIPHQFDGECVVLFLENGTKVAETTADDPVGIATDWTVELPYEPPAERRQTDDRADTDDTERDSPGDSDD